MSPPAFNQRNPAVKRIHQEMKEMREEASGDFIAEALETDIFEWHFVVRGPKDTEFEGGIYHGRILLPPEYPFKPPAFMMLSPSGRFETGMKICLSISSHHPEHWQPSWSVRTALTAMVAFMPTPGNNALGSLEFTKEERRVLAAASRVAAPKFGSPDRQRVCDEMHQRMLDIDTQQRAKSSKAEGSTAAVVSVGQTEVVPPTVPEGADMQKQADDGKVVAAPVASVTASVVSEPAVAVASTRVSPAVPQPSPVPITSTPAGGSAVRPAVTTTPAAVAVANRVVAPAVAPVIAQVAESHSDRGLTLLAYGLAFAILAILAKKALSLLGSYMLELPALD